MLALFVDLALMTIFDKGADRMSQTFPIHRSTKSLFKTGCPWMLQVVMVPLYCSLLEFLWDDKFAILAQYFQIFHQLRILYASSRLSLSSILSVC